jgi:hypothetical protein
LVVILFAVSAWTQITPGDDAYTLTSAGSTSFGSSGVLDLQSVPQDFTSGVIKKEVTKGGTNPDSAYNNLLPTVAVRTGALLELHAMRQSAVALCIQLPTKYRTHLPECADIFKHEIRLQALAKHSQ